MEIRANYSKSAEAGTELTRKEFADDVEAEIEKCDRSHCKNQTRRQKRQMNKRNGEGFAVKSFLPHVSIHRLFLYNRMNEKDEIE